MASVKACDSSTTKPVHHYPTTRPMGLAFAADIDVELACSRRQHCMALNAASHPSSTSMDERSKRAHGHPQHLGRRLAR